MVDLTRKNENEKTTDEILVELQADPAALATELIPGLVKAEKQYVHGTDFTVSSDAVATVAVVRGGSNTLSNLRWCLENEVQHQYNSRL